MTIGVDLGALVHPTISGVVYGFVLALTAIGLTIIFGVLDVPNFAQGEFAAVAGFATIALMSLGVGLIPSAIAALVFVFLLGVAMEDLVISKFYEEKMEDFFVLTFFASFGVVLISSSLLVYFFGDAFYHQIPRPELGSVSIFGVTISQIRLVVMAVAIAFLGGFYLYTRKTYTGLAMRAIANDEVGAGYIGVNRNKINKLTWGIGCLVTGVSGILYGMLFPLDPTIGVPLTAFAFVIVVVGGVGSFAGALYASLLIGVIQSYTVTFLDGRFRLLMVFVLLFLVLYLKPEGLKGAIYD